jgi:hypothetical protein
MHYQEQLDKIFANGNMWQHRTLRTVFDPYSTEYKNTEMSEKIEILRIIKANGIDLNYLITKYKHFYIEEGKADVANDVEAGLILITEALLSEKMGKSS